MTNPIAANPGWIRPPLVFGITAAIGMMFQLFIPLPLGLAKLSMALSASIFLVGIGLFFWTKSTFKIAGTPIPGHQPATKLIVNGPFKFSRNPMYISFSLFHIAVAVWTNSTWIIFGLWAALSVINFVVVPREENFMANKFGDEFLRYIATTRRWL